MWPRSDDFVLVLQAGRAPLLRIGIATATLPTEMRKLAATVIVEHRPWRRGAAPGGGVETVIGPFDRCLQGVHLCWDGARLIVQRGMDSGTHMFVAQGASRIVVGSTLDAVRGEVDAVDLETDPRALLDLHFLGRVLPPFTLHRGIASLGLGAAVVADARGSTLELSWQGGDQAMARWVEQVAAAWAAIPPESLHVSSPESEPAPVAPHRPPISAFDLIPLCATLTGLPTGDASEMAYLAIAMSADTELPDPLHWATAAAPAQARFAPRREPLVSGWPGGLLARALATDELLAHRDAWWMRRRGLLDALQQSLRRPHCKGLSAAALFDAAIVLPDRVARLRRIATACGHAVDGMGDRLQAATGWLHAGQSEARRPTAASPTPAAAGWGDNPVDRMSMLTLQQRPGCVSRFFPMSPLRARAYRHALSGPRGAALSQRLAAILAAQFIEEQVAHSRSFHLDAA